LASVLLIVSGVGIKIKVMERIKEFEVLDNREELTEPHFDEEWTVLTARPVVPFEEVSHGKGRGVLKLVGAFGAAILLGALVALASIRLRQESANGDNALRTSEEVQPTGELVVSEAAGELQRADQSEVAETSEPTIEAVDQTPIKFVHPKKRTNEKPPTSTIREPASLEVISEEVRSEPKLVDQWEEQRPRRAFKQRRLLRLERQSIKRRDLFRIDEIFEGTGPTPNH
jgi:hypothetical protein